MGFQDREYMRPPSQKPPSYIKTPQWHPIFWCMIVCVVLGGLKISANGVKENFFDVSYQTIIVNWQIWSLFFSTITPSLDFNGIIFLLMLFFLAKQQLEIDGLKEFLFFIFVTGVLGGIIFVLSFIPFRNSDAIGLVLSGHEMLAIEGVLGVYAGRFPQRTISLYFLLPIKAIWLFVAIIIITSISILSSNNSFAYLYLIPTLFAYLFGFSYGKWRWNLQSFFSFSRFKLKVPSGFSLNSQGKELSGMTEEEVKKEVDRLLDKISVSGTSSLNKREIEFLKNSSKKY